MNYYFIEIAFDGSDFSGWQSQPNKSAVQDAIQYQLSNLYKTKISVNGSSRTDAGVHSLGLGASFATPIKPYIPLKNIKHFLNNAFSNKIYINHVKEVSEDFHARYSSLGKTYSYLINIGKDTNPFLSKYSIHLPKFQNLCEVRKALKYIEGEHDFKSFTVKQLKNNITDTVRTIYKVDLIEFDNMLSINFTGNGFLYKMIRSLMGSIIDIGTDLLTSQEILRLFEIKNRSEASRTAPPHALFLRKVFYDKKEMEDHKITKLPFL